MFSSSLVISKKWQNQQGTSPSPHRDRPPHPQGSSSPSPGIVLLPGIILPIPSYQFARQQQPHFLSEVSESIVVQYHCPWLVEVAENHVGRDQDGGSKIKMNTNQDQDQDKCLAKVTWLFVIDYSTNKNIPCKGQRNKGLPKRFRVNEPEQVRHESLVPPAKEVVEVLVVQSVQVDDVRD